MLKMGHFTEETLLKFNAMCAEGMDFGEGPTYDFARCLMSNGEYYGVSDGEQCKVGKRVPDAKEGEGNKGTDTRMAKLKKAFMKKIGREMKPAELAKAQNMMGIGVPIPKGKSAEDVLQQLLPKGEKVVPVKSA